MFFLPTYLQLVRQHWPLAPLRSDAADRDRRRAEGHGQRAGNARGPPLTSRGLEREKELSTMKIAELKATLEKPAGAGKGMTWWARGKKGREFA